MYIPIWLIMVFVIIGYFVCRSYKQRSQEAGTVLQNSKISVEDIEENVSHQKDNRIFSLEHFDSPHFIDVQNAFDSMEANYFRLKQRFSHNPEKVMEIANDWYNFLEALGDLKYARVMLDLDISDDAFENADESSKEPSILKDEVEKKFKSMLGDDWQEIPPDYFKRMETMEKPDKKTREEMEIANDWKYYYRDSVNLYKLEEKRRGEDRNIGKNNNER